MSAKSKGTRFPELVQFLAPKGTNAALDRLATRNSTSSRIDRECPEAEPLVVAPAKRMFLEAHEPSHHTLGRTHVPLPEMPFDVQA